MPRESLCSVLSASATATGNSACQSVSLRTFSVSRSVLSSSLESPRTITTAKYPFFLAGYRYIDVRMFDTKSYALSVLHEIGGGVALGPLEPEVRIGIHLIELDVFRGSYNASLFSPRVAAGAPSFVARRNRWEKSAA